MRAWKLPVALLAGLLSLSTVAARFGMPDPASERYARIQDVYVQMMIAGILVFVLVVGALVFILVNFREGGQGKATYEKHRENMKAELAWTIIPLIMMIWIGAISFTALAELDDGLGQDEEPYTTVVIEGYQWFWAAKYPDSGLSVAAIPGPAGELDAIKPIVVPADVPVRYEVIGMDVIHSFNIVALGQTLDAVPGQINVLTAKLPEGEYFTQCKQQCLNPGHGYMRAKVIAMPIPEYDAWVEAELAGAAAGLQQGVPMELNGAMLTNLQGDKVAKGATGVIQIANSGSEAQTVTIGEESFEVGPGALGTLEYKFEEVGDLTIASSGGASYTLNVVEPISIPVDLGAFEFEYPQGTPTLQAGEVYVFEVTNVHGTGHNAYLGSYEPRNIIWQSKTIGPNEATAFLVTPTESGAVTIWCDVPGHVDAGMIGELTIS